MNVRTVCRESVHLLPIPLGPTCLTPWAPVRLLPPVTPAQSFSGDSFLIVLHKPQWGRLRLLWRPAAACALSPGGLTDSRTFLPSPTPRALVQDAHAKSLLLAIIDWTRNRLAAQSQPTNTDGRRKPLGGSSLLSPFSRGTHVPRAANQALPGTEWTPKLHFQSHCCSRSSSSLFPAARRNPNSVPREEPGAWCSGELWSLTFVKLFISWVIPHDSF